MFRHSSGPAGKAFLVLALGGQPHAAFGQSPDLAALGLAQAEQLLQARNRELRTAKRLESASTEDLSDTYRQQRLALRSAYYDLLFAQNKADIVQDNAILFQDSTRAAELRLKAGDIAAADVSRLRVDALRAANDARAADADRRRAQLALAYLIGAEAQAGAIRATDPWPEVIAVDVSSV